jgi:hypothetical protein
LIERREKKKSDREAAEKAQDEPPVSIARSVNAWIY